MTERFIREADRQLQDAYEEPMDLSEYVEAAMEEPGIAAQASRYLLSAIESLGTRTVVEEGKQRERYRFFDDPHNDGEHAILGNTAVLNAFVDDLRTIAANRGKGEKIVWFDGPTATGKSELKRCLVNGLREYSKTPEGRRYTLEWNVSGTNDAGLSYGGERTDDEAWYESPVQTHPLSVFPGDVREEIVAELNERTDGPPIAVETELDPFSREAYEYLESRYRRDGRTDLFSAITHPQHLRVSNYVVDVGRGIGILHAEDEGRPKERLVGSWMSGMLRELDSRGRKNPQAFSYDGVLSQGNGLLTIVEDASQHADLLRKLLNVPDDRRVKLDKGIGMDIDTQMIIISNPDLDVELDQYADRNGRDPLKALKRRLERHEFRYLTSRRLEAELIHRELTDETQIWGDPIGESEREASTIEFDTVPGDQSQSPEGPPSPDRSSTSERSPPIAGSNEPWGIGGTAGSNRPGGGTNPQAATGSTAPAGADRSVDLGRRVRSPIEMEVRGPAGQKTTKELAPHAIGAAALYSVVTRLDPEDLPSGYDLVDKAILFEQGYLQEGDDRIDIDEFEFAFETDGRNGIPVTYTRDVIADLLGETFDRGHPDLPVEHVIMPRDVLDATAEGLSAAPVFSRAEAKEYETRLSVVKEQVLEEQEADVLDALLAEKRVSEETVAEYVEHVYAWEGESQIEGITGPVDPDPLLMKLFEVEHLGRFDESDYAGSDPSGEVETFRREKVITALNRYAWEHRDEEFSVEDVDLRSIPVIRAVLDTYDWDDVERLFPDFDPRQWDDPPEGTETAELKEDAIEQLCDRDYSPASAELTTRRVMQEVAHRWD